MTEQVEQQASTQQTAAGDLSKLLLECRENAGMSKAEMASLLRLSENVIDALENEQFSELKAPTYIKGYLRTYALKGNKDETELYRMYESLADIEPETYLSANPKSTLETAAYNESELLKKLKKFIIPAAVLALLFAISMIPEIRATLIEQWNKITSTATSEQSAVNNNSDGRELSNKVFSNLSAINNDTVSAEEKKTADVAEKLIDTTAEDATEKLTNAATSNTAVALAENEDATKTLDQSPPSDAPKASETPPTSTEEAPEVDQAIQESPNQAAADGALNLQFEFTEEVWVQVVDRNGQAVLKGLFPAKSVQTAVVTERPAQITVGNAPGASLNINGDTFDLTEHTKRTVAKFTLP